MDFVHLHNHSEYSILDGMCRIDEMIDMAKKYGMESIALTDHGNMFGAIYFYKKASNKEINPIIGCEIYTTDDRFKKDKESKTYHLILLAKDYTGYKNLMKIVSIGHVEGFYFKPRVDWEILEKYREGLIATSACLQGNIQQRLLAKDKDGAKDVLYKYLDIYGDDFYIELMNHGIDEEIAILPEMYKLAKDNNVKVIATNDMHYIHESDYDYHRALLSINTGKKLTDENKLEFTTNEFYFKSPDQMKELFKDYPDAIENTLEIAEKCNLKLVLDDASKALFPKIEIPENYSSIDEYFEDMAWKGLKERFPNGVSDEYKDRLKYELEMIRRMKFEGFFILLKDLIDEARRRNIPVGPGRGSAAGSLLLYSLRITDIDPLKYNLFFERFINPERVTMPDVDIDFSDDRRDELYEYAREKFGEKKVARIITFVSMKSKAILRDVGRVMNIPLAEVNRIVKEFDKDTGGDPSATLSNAKNYPSFWKKMNEKEEYKKMLEYAIRMEGLIKSSGLHAAGMVISPDDITEYAPLYRDKNGVIATQYDMKSVESVGLLKFDLLGLRTLTTIRYAEDMVKEIDPQFDINKVDTEDKKVYEMIGKGDTSGVFQLESRGMREFLKRFKPEKFTDLILAIAFYRPGPMQYMDILIDRREGKQPIEYRHPAMEKILSETYGIMVYQEQVMQVASELAGFSLGEADILRRAIGKKKKDLMDKMKKKFVDGCVNNGISEKTANDVYSDIEKFAQYGFNKSHATAYAMLAYQTAYLKSHYPIIFMAAQLNSVIHNPDKIAFYLEEAKKMGINVKYPSINKGGAFFKWENDSIIVAMGGIKNVGTSAALLIEEERDKNGEYKDFFDFMERVYSIDKINSRAISFMIKAGVFDEFNPNRKALLESYEDVIKYVENKIEMEKKGYMSLFGSPSVNIKKPEIKEVEWSDEERWQMERESLGFFVKDTPLDRYRMEWELFSTIKLGELKDFLDEKDVNIICMIKSKVIKTRRKKILIAPAMDFTGNVELVAYDDEAEKFNGIIEEDKIYLIKGRTRSRESEDSNITIIIKDAIPVYEIWEKHIEGVKIFINKSDLEDEKFIEELYNTVTKYKGNKKLIFTILDGKSSYPPMISKSIKVNINNSFIESIKDLDYTILMNI